MASRLQRGGRVPDVVGVSPMCTNPRVVAELLLEAGQERDHLVLDLLLDGEDAPMSTRVAPNLVHDRGRIRPCRAYAPQTAISTFSHAPYFVSSLQIRPIAGRVYRSIMRPSP